MRPTVTIRDATPSDWTAIFPIVRSVAAEQTTFAMDAEPDEGDARAEWTARPPGRTVVAQIGEAVVGAANMYPNRPNQGAHVASGSFMVADTARGRGVGRALVRDMVEWARLRRYTAIQFNAVVQTNTAAVNLYTSEGFRVVGSAPGAFRHPDLGPVDLLMMWRDLP